MIEDSMTRVQQKCDSIILEIDQLLYNITQDAKVNKQYDHQLEDELRKLQKVCRKISNAIASKGKKLVVEIVTFDNPLIGGQIVHRRFAPDILRYDITATGFPLAMDQTTMHELGHEFGVKGESGGWGWTKYANHFETLTTHEVKYDPWYTYLWAKMHYKPGDPNPPQPPPNPPS
jgi:hypothetical protein